MEHPSARSAREGKFVYAWFKIRILPIEINKNLDTKVVTAVFLKGRPFDVVEYYTFLVLAIDVLNECQVDPH